MYDVAIIGGGPGGSTTGCLLKKYNPSLKVLILEREQFPREHVGESQLPPIQRILDEMGCWQDVENAGFPIKIGVSYTWGKTVDPWRFEFLPLTAVPENPQRPGKYEGWRQQVAFQVDRAVYDDILLKHARKMGCEVREQTRVKSAQRDGDKVTGLELDNGEVITARYYVDASGNAAVLRRTMDVKVEIPTLLKNVAFYDYWTNPAWANDKDRINTRIHIRSLGYGWIWYIPISLTRTSVGLVCNADWYRTSGKSPQELHDTALASEPFIAKKLEHATCRQKLVTTTDWSFVVDRTYGENWFLVGECGGFADPILSAGLTLTQAGARELAFTILELDRNELPREWLVERYSELQTRRVRQHMKFAEFWYSANGLFDEVRENVVRIAEQSGLSLSMADAFYWLSTGGLGDDVPGQVGVGGCDAAAMKQLIQRFSGRPGGWQIDGKNIFKLNLEGAQKTKIGMPDAGRIAPVDCYVRGERKLPLTGVQGTLVAALSKHSRIDQIFAEVSAAFAREQPEHVHVWMHHTVQVLEVMANNGWVTCDLQPGLAVLNVSTPDEGTIIHTDHTWQAV